MSSTIDSPYLTAEEAAVYLNFTSADWFRQAVKRYGIPCLRRGRRMFFTRQSLDEFMAVADEATNAPRKRRARR